jgi:hypothetical protein
MENTINTINNENTILFTIGRMNPPTSGHMMLIRKMMLYALNNNLTQINLILSGTVDNKKNPISCNEKRNLLIHFLLSHQKELLKIENPSLSSKIDELQVKIICMDDVLNPEYGTHPIMKSVNYILKELYGYPRENIRMILFIGQDRENDYFWIQKSLRERNPQVSLDINSEGLERPEGAISATYIRQLAIDGNWDEFKNEMFKTGLDEPRAYSLYLQIKGKLVPIKKTRTKKGGRRKANSKSRSKSRKARRKSRKAA